MKFEGTTNEYLNPADPIPEYRNNVCIGALGPIASPKKILERLTRSPKLPPDIATMERHLQPHVVRGMSTLFLPTTSQIAAIQEIEILIRRGYLHRNPMDRKYRRICQEDMVALREKRDIPERHQNVGGGCVLGPPGTGKTSIVVEVASMWGSRIHHCYEHEQGRFAFVQVPTLHLRLYADASLRSLGIDFFRKLAEHTGIEALENRVHGLNGNTVQPEIISAIREFHVGVIIVDDAQNMSSNIRGYLNVLNYFVRLMNITGVPVILIGTSETEDYINQDESVRRRYCTSIPRFDRLSPPVVNARTEGIFIKLLKQFPFFSQATPSSDQYRVAYSIHVASNGIPDLAVKICMYVQVRHLANPKEKVGVKYVEICANALLSNVALKLSRLSPRNRKKVASVVAAQDQAFEECFADARMAISSSDDPADESRESAAPDSISVDEELQRLEAQGSRERFT